MKLRRFVLLSFIVLLVAPHGVAAQQTVLIFPGDTWEYYETPEDAGYSSGKLEELRKYVIDSSNTTGLVVVVGGKVLARYGDI